MTKIYKCECGKILNSPQSFNGHKSNCKVHLKATGKLEARQLSRQQSFSKISKSVHNYCVKQQEEKLAAWLATNPTCERCGKLMTEKYGSGRFCSRACSNTRTHSEATKEKIRLSSKLAAPEAQAARREVFEAAYLQNPKLCKVCGEIIPCDLRNRITCSDYCYGQLRADIRMNTIETLGLHQNYRYGFYHGIECDSGWELAFLLYQLNTGANIKRNSDYFIYYIDGVAHRYYPDFIIDGVYYEIKGYKDERFYEKLKQFPADSQLVVIDASNITQYIKYAEETFGPNFYELYDTDRPNWTQVDQGGYT